MEKPHIWTCSVLRFIPSSNENDTVSDVLRKLEEILSEPSQKHVEGSGFSVTISESLDFEEHLKSLKKFIDKFHDQVFIARENEIHLVFDVGFSNEFKEKIPSSYRRLTIEDLEMLYKNVIELEISIYWATE